MCSGSPDPFSRIAGSVAGLGSITAGGERRLILVVTSRESSGISFTQRESMRYWKLITIIAAVFNIAMCVFSENVPRSISIMGWVGFLFSVCMAWILDEMRLKLDKLRGASDAERDAMLENATKLNEQYRRESLAMSFCSIDASSTGDVTLETLREAMNKMPPPLRRLAFIALKKDRERLLKFMDADVGLTECPYTDPSAIHLLFAIDGNDATDISYQYRKIGYEIRLLGDVISGKGLFE